METKLKRILLISLSTVATICLGYSTFVFFKRQKNTNDYVLNDNKKYLINEYNSLIKDVNIYNEQIYVINSYYEMNISNNYISNLNISFENSNNSRFYYLKIEENYNKLSIQEKNDIIDKTISINEYFQICCSGYQTFNQNTCKIESDLRLSNNIQPSDNNYIYENSKTSLLKTVLEGQFMEFKFSNSLNETINVYYQI